MCRLLILDQNPREPASPQVALHHYVLKSLEEYKVRHARLRTLLLVRRAITQDDAGTGTSLWKCIQEKMARGSAMNNSKPLSFFNAIDAEAQLDCPDGLRVGFIASRPLLLQSCPCVLIRSLDPSMTSGRY